MPEPSPMHSGGGSSSLTLFIHPFHSKSQFFHSTRLPTPSAPSRGWAGILLLPQGTSVHDALHGRLIITSLLPLPLQVGTAQYGDHFPFQLAPAHGAVISAVLCNIFHLIPDKAAAISLTFSLRLQGRFLSGSQVFSTCFPFGSCSRQIINAVKSAGLTPEMRLACPKFRGRMAFSFSRASRRSPSKWS